MKSSNFSNSLNVRKLRFQKRFIIAAPVFLLACWKATATHEFQPSLWCPAIRGRCSNGRAAGAKAQDLTFVKRCYLKKKQIVFQGRFFQVFICWGTWWCSIFFFLFCVFWDCVKWLVFFGDCFLLALAWFERFARWPMVQTFCLVGPWILLFGTPLTYAASWHVRHCCGGTSYCCRPMPWIQLPAWQLSVRWRELSPKTTGETHQTPWFFVF